MKAFTCDFDGTLYFHHRDRVVSEEDVAAIRAYQETGALFGVCGGRPPRAIMLQAGHLVDPDYFISVSGALVTDAEGNVLSECRMPYDAVVELRGAYGPRSTGVVISAGRDYYTIGNRNHHVIRDVPSLSELPSSLYGITFGMASDAAAAELAMEIDDRLGDVVVAYHNAASVEVTARGCSKERALATVKAALGVDLMAAMGDACNDVALLEAADVAYSFADAPKELVGAADQLVGSVSAALADFSTRGDRAPVPLVA